MPRKKTDPAMDIEYLSILDENGTVDAEHEPDISSEMHLKMHKALYLSRRFDEWMLNLQRQGRIGTFPPITGQEASQVGSIVHLGPSDWFVPSFRETAAELWRGRSMESILLYYAGFNEGVRIEKDQHDLPVSIPVGSQLLHAVGIAWGMKYRKQDDVVMTFFGDGATSEGDFHEALNFAGVFQLPVVFVCQNNQWAISIPVSRQTRSKTLVQKAIAYDLPGIQVDGNDILAVYVAAKEAVERARTEKIPTLIECVTYRMQVHTTADDPKRYRSDEEVESWKQKDPLQRYQNYLKDKGVLSSEEIGSIESGVMEEIKKAVKKFESDAETMGDPMDMFNHVYAELPEDIRLQKEYLHRLLAENRKKV